MHLLCCWHHLVSSMLSATCRPDLHGLPWRCSAADLPWCLQGLTLNEPEVVPFRLTQNMIDAFGVAGVEGVFRKTCEVSLEVSSLLCKRDPPCYPCSSGRTEGEKGNFVGLSTATSFS